jgi:hypothetical protein
MRKTAGVSDVKAWYNNLSQEDKDTLTRTGIGAGVGGLGGLALGAITGRKKKGLDALAHYAGFGLGGAGVGSLAGYGYDRYRKGKDKEAAELRKLEEERKQLERELAAEKEASKKKEAKGKPGAMRQSYIDAQNERKQRIKELTAALKQNQARRNELALAHRDEGKVSEQGANQAREAFMSAGGVKRVNGKLVPMIKGDRVEANGKSAYYNALVANEQTAADRYNKERSKRRDRFTSGKYVSGYSDVVAIDENGKQIPNAEFLGEAGDGLFRFNVDGVEQVLPGKVTNIDPANLHAELFNARKRRASVGNERAKHNDAVEYAGLIPRLGNTILEGAESIGRNFRNLGKVFVGGKPEHEPAPGVGGELSATDRAITAKTNSSSKRLRNLEEKLKLYEATMGEHADADASKTALYSKYLADIMRKQRAASNKLNAYATTIGKENAGKRKEDLMREQRVLEDNIRRQQDELDKLRIEVGKNNDLTLTSDVAANIAGGYNALKSGIKSANDATADRLLYDMFL